MGGLGADLAIDWGRYGELYDYDSVSDEIPQTPPPASTTGYHQRRLEPLGEEPERIGFGQSQLLRRNVRYNRKQALSITSSTAGYPHTSFNSGM